MRIISKFKDYYDGAIVYGIDPKLVYLRETKEIDLKTFKIKNHAVYKNFSCPIYEFAYVASVIGFCGKAYTVFTIDILCSDFCSKTNVPRFIKHYYSYKKLCNDIREENINKYIINHISLNNGNKFDIDYAKSQLNELKKIVIHKDNLSNKYRNKYRYTMSDEEYEKIVCGTNIGDDIFRELDAPVFMLKNYSGINWEAVSRGSLYKYRDERLTTNPRLANFNFGAQIDPVTAFQELSMYLGNNLVHQKDPIVNHSDELKAEIHGFDKWSFRTHKDDKKCKKKSL